MRSIGEYTYCPTQLTVHYEEYANLFIGKFCSIAHGVEIFLGGEHRKDWITQHPIHMVFGEENDGHPATKGNVIIGNDVWIGQGTVVLSGVTVGDGATIGARAVVGKDIKSYGIYIGNPAREIGMRFLYEEILKLHVMKWWDWPIELIKEARQILQSNDVERLWEFYNAKKNW